LIPPVPVGYRLGTMGHWIRRTGPLAVAVVVIGLGIAWLTRPAPERAVVVDTVAAPAPLRAPQAADPPQPHRPTSGPADAPQPPADAAAPPAADPPPDDVAEDPNATQDAIAAAWASIDLEAVRAAMPDNLYFKLSAPTTDEAVLAERAAERARWNVAYGKVLSGTATEEEIGAYFDHRARLSTDYVEFTTYLLDHHRDTLHERDVALLELARRMHATRLQEVPRQVEEAMLRKQQQDAARAAWLAGEAEFKGEDGGGQ